MTAVSKAPRRRVLHPANLELAGGWRRAGTLLAVAALAIAAGTGCTRPAPGHLPREEERSREQRLAAAAIERLEARIAERPRNAVDRTALARLYLRRGRERHEFADFERAEALAREALILTRGNRAARNSLVAALQAQHRFSEALALARENLEADPDDRVALAAVSDCLLELGRYAEAEQRLVDLLERDRSPPALARWARWQELSGLPQEAIETLSAALEAAHGRPADEERRAWYGWRLGSLHLGAGEIAEAEAAFARALALAPEDPASLAGLAAVRTSQGRFDEATAHYERSIEIQEAPPALWTLGELWEARGNPDEAQRWYARAEALIREEATSSAGDAHRSEAARFFADRGRDSAYALEKARADLAERRDIYTWDTYAWALLADGRAAEAALASRQALRLGTRDAWLHYHAGRIALANDDRQTGRRHLEEALAIHPGFSPLHGEIARELLNAR